MKTKTIRLPDDILKGIELVENEEKLEEATAIRKMLRIGFETYVSELYRDGKISLREAAELLQRSLPETIDLFLQRGIKGNLDADDVVDSLKRVTDY